MRYLAKLSAGKEYTAEESELFTDCRTITLAEPSAPVTFHVGRTYNFDLAKFDPAEYHEACVIFGEAFANKMYFGKVPFDRGGTITVTGIDRGR